MEHTPSLWKHFEVNPAAGTTEVILLEQPARDVLISLGSSSQKLAFRSDYMVRQGITAPTPVFVVTSLSDPIIFKDADIREITIENTSGGAVLTTGLYRY